MKKVYKTREKKAPAFSDAGVSHESREPMQIRIKDPEPSLKFYRDVMGLTLVDKYDFEQFSFSLYFLQSLPAGTEYTLTPGSDEAHKYLWSTPGVTLELTHNWGTEKEDGKVYHAGNEDKDGFGHLALACEDVYKCSEELEAAGIQFKKRPDEGRMKVRAARLDNPLTRVKLPSEPPCCCVVVLSRTHCWSHGWVRAGAGVRV